MFASSRRSGPPTTLGALTLIGLAVLLWPRGEAPPEVPVEEAPAGPTVDLSDADAHLAEVLAGHTGGSLYHLGCLPGGCVATVRIPIPQGADAAWRHHFEQALQARGWSLVSAGRVRVYDRSVFPGGEVLPERAFYTLSMRADPGPPPAEQREALKAAIEAQAEVAGNAFGPW